MTVLIPAKDEARNIGGALTSVIGWAERVVVIDSYSSDGTAEIARSAGADVVQFRHLSDGPKKKRWALQHVDITTPWILLLDADERVPDALRDEIAIAVTQPDVHGWYIDRDFRFLGRSLEAFRPNWNLRLMRPEHARLEDFGLDSLPGTGDNEIHEHFLVTGVTRYLRNPLLHDDYRGIGPWIRRHDTYATWEAALYDRFAEESLTGCWQALRSADPVRRNRMLRRLWVRVPCKPVLRFVGWYVLRGGFRDGYPGFVYSLLMGWYELLISLKRREAPTPVDRTVS